MTGEGILVLGATGMLGHVLIRGLAGNHRVTLGTRRGPASQRSGAEAGIVGGVDAHDFSTVERVVAQTSPRVVVNCIGLVKQLAEASDPVRAIEINALFPHRLAALCRAAGARLVHISTDCVFSGAQGRYRESDNPDPDDLYGRSKLLGEVQGPGVLTLRTSIIGHELGTSHGLLEWFLAQRGEVNGFTRAIYSGFPTCELARIVEAHVLPNPSLEGLYHVSSAPISKYELLRLIARAYGKEIAIRPSDSPVCDRSLVSERFRAATGYAPPSWPDLVAAMHRDHLEPGSPRPAQPTGASA